MCITTVSNKKHMNKHYIEQPMPMLELKFDMIIYNKPPLMNALDRSITHPIFRKYRYISFN